MSPTRRITFGAALAAAVIMAPLPALTSAASAVTSAACATSTPSTSRETAPAPGATATYSAGDAGSVSLARSRTDSRLFVTGTAPASGYTARVVSTGTTTVKVAFKNATSGGKTVFTAHLGTSNPNQITIHLSVC